MRLSNAVAGLVRAFFSVARSDSKAWAISLGPCMVLAALPTGAWVTAGVSLVSLVSLAVSRAGLGSSTSPWLGLRCCSGRGLWLVLQGLEFIKSQAVLALRLQLASKASLV